MSIKQFFSKGRAFPCPYCTKDVIATKTGHGAYTLAHKVPGCRAYDNPTKRTNAVLLSSFVSYCKPKDVFPPIEGLEDPKASIFK